MDDSGMDTGQDWQAPGNLASYFGQSDWTPYGYSGNIWGTYANGQGESASQYNDLTPEAKAWMEQNGYSLRGDALPGDGNYGASLVNRNGIPVSNAYFSDTDPAFGMLIDAGVGAVTGGALGGGGLFGSFGLSPTITGGLNGAFAGGLSAAGKEGNILQGIAAGGLGGYAGNTDFAKGLSQFGITNPALQKGITAAGASTLANVVSGNDLGSSLKSGLTSGITTGAVAGMNGMWDQIGKNYLGGETSTDFGSLQGSGGDMSGQTDVTPSSYSDSSPNYRYGGDQPAPVIGGFHSSAAGASQQEDSGGNDLLKSISSYLPDTGQLGSFVGNNAGTLAQLIYGMYNNRKQQNALSGQMAGLQGLYGQNSPYAQQLRAKLQAQAAQRGQRANTGSREVQLQAALADRAASMAPTMFQMQQGMGNLQNQFGQTLLGGFNKLGGMQGLQSLFNTQPYQFNNGNVTGSDSFGWKGSGGF